MNRTVAAFPAHLAERLGPSAQAPELTARIEAALGRHAFSTVIAPPDAAAVAAALAACSEEGWPVLPAGAATWLRQDGAGTLGRGSHRSRGVASHGPRSAGTDQRPPVVISTARLHAVLEHEPADLVIGVQAGTPVDAVHQALAAKQQWLPLDPPAARAATVGAVAALGSSGPLRAAHGTPRDMVLGVEIATGDGRLIRFGGRVVKNVAGYDGVRLSVASAGRLGIITALYLRVRGTPRSDRTLAIACGSGADGMGRGADTARALRDSIACDALELISPAVAARLSGRTQSDWLLLVRMLGSAAAADDGLARVKAIAGAASELPPDIWPALVRLEAEAGAFLRLMGSTTTLDQGLGLASMVPAKASQSDEWMTAAHAMDGIVRLWNPDATSALSRDLVGEAVREAARHDWTVRYESNEATHPSEQTRPGAEPAATTHAGDLIRRRLEDRLKAVFDPAGILPAGAGA